MNFQKYVRQNSRMLLMIVMSLLLVAFLVPNTIQGFGGRDRVIDRKWGRAFGRAVTEKELQVVRADIELLRKVHPRLAPRTSDESAVEYFLLVEEARQAGVRFGRAEVTPTLLAAGVTDEYLQNVQRSTGRSYEDIYDVVGRWLAVQQLVSLQSRALLDSLPRQELAYRDQSEEALAQVSVIDDKAFLHRVPEPTDEQLQAFFGECKDRLTEHTDRELKFGYRLPDRVQVEYLTVDPQKIKTHITVQAVQVKRYFEENAARYTKPDPLASQPADGQAPQVQMTFEEARDKVREDYRESKAVEAAQRLINDIYLKAHQPWAAQQRDSNGFVPAPETPAPAFEDLKREFSTTYEVEYVKTELLSQQDLQRLPGIGGAVVTFGRQVLRVPELALRVQGVLAHDPNDGKPVLNVQEPAPVVFTTRPDPVARRSVPFQAYLFRVAAAAPAAAPESLDVVRTQLIADWKLVQAHELARQQAEKLADSARQNGLAAAVEQDSELKDILAAGEQADQAKMESPPAPGTTLPKYVDHLKPYTPQRLTRQGGFVEGLGRTTDLPDELFKLGQGAATEGVHRVVGVSIAGLNKWVVAELTEIKAPYRGSFEAQVASRLRGSNDRDAQRLSRDWFDPNSIQARTGFVPEIGARPAPAGS
jgi:hypothetical protein